MPPPMTPPSLNRARPYGRCRVAAVGTLCPPALPPRGRGIARGAGVSVTVLRAVDHRAAAGHREYEHSRNRPAAHGGCAGHRARRTDTADVAAVHGETPGKSTASVRAPCPTGPRTAGSRHRPPQVPALRLQSPAPASAPASAPQPYPSSCNRSSSMPKWWATSCTTVISTSRTTSRTISARSPRSSPTTRSVGPR